MNKVFENLDAHAYVDNNLAPTDRLNFEAALRRDARLRARVEAWENQNDAIRLAFGGAPKSLRQAPQNGRRSRGEGANGQSIRSEPAQQRALARVKFYKSRQALCRPIVMGALVFLVAFAAVPGDNNDPRSELIRRADADLRIATVFADARLDIVSDNPNVVAEWLEGRFARVDAGQLSPPGWSLVGARIVSGVHFGAALVLFDDAIGGRAALMLEPTDGLATQPPSVDRSDTKFRAAGVTGRFAYAVVGPARSGVQTFISALAAHPGP